MNQCAHMHTTMRVIRWRLATPRKQFLRGLIGPMEYIKLHQFLGGGKQNFWKELNAAAHWSSFRLPISIPPAFNQGLRADCPHWKPLHTISISDEWSPVFVFFCMLVSYWKLIGLLNLQIKLRKWCIVFVLYFQTKSVLNKQNILYLSLQENFR